jgi:hypothetical protein
MAVAVTDVPEFNEKEVGQMWPSPVPLIELTPHKRTRWQLWNEVSAVVGYRAQFDAMRERTARLREAREALKKEARDGQAAETEEHVC